jgi:hypothetical protein
MVNQKAAAVLAALALATTNGLTPEAQAAPPPPAVFRIGLVGDSGYNARGQANFMRVRDRANASGLAFVVHDGDIWLGGTSCDDDRLRRVKEDFNGFRALVYTPGDNEWVDCPQGPAGRLEAIRRVFFSEPKSLGTEPIPQRRQADVPENARWEWGGVVFATLNVPGPGGGGPTLRADLAWLDKTFDRAKEIRAPAVMIIWQDDPVDGSSPELVSRLRTRAKAFGQPVLLVHGDTHRYRLDNPWKDTSNLTRLETFPTFTPEWVKVIVKPAGPDVFTIVRVRA